MRTLVLGLGNPLLTDDGVGLRVARELRSLLAARAEVDLGEDYHGGLRLMERMIGYERAVVIDAIRTGRAAGTVRALGLDELPTRHGGSPHDTDLPTALELGRLAGVRLPECRNVLLVGVEAADVTTFGERCTPPVEAAVTRAVQVVLALLQDGSGCAWSHHGGATTLPRSAALWDNAPLERRPSDRAAERPTQ